MSDEIYIWTDGSCINNGQANARASIAIFFQDYDDDNRTWNLCTKCSSTNNIAELRAVEKAMEWIRDNADDYDDYRFVVCTDSQYVIDCLEKWCPKWIRRDWINSKGYEVANREIIERVYDHYVDIPYHYDVEIELRKVSAHSGAYGNEQVDQMAYQAALNNTWVCDKCASSSYSNRWSYSSYSSSDW